MDRNIDLNYVLSKFILNAKIEAYGNGHINDTYRTSTKDCILQRINTNVFRNPEGMMNNIAAITDFLREKIIAEGGDPDRETLTVIKTYDGKNSYRVDNNNVFRVYKFIIFV